MAIGWCVNLAQADAYFEIERLITKCWDGITGSADLDKTKVLIQAYNRLYYSTEFTLPTYASATSLQLIILVKAQCEMGYYLCLHLDDEDIRKNLQAQGVVKAGVVKEDYKSDMLMQVPIPPFVYDILKKGGFVTKTQFKIVEIERDMNKGIKK